MTSLHTHRNPFTDQHRASVLHLLDHLRLAKQALADYKAIVNAACTAAEYPDAVIDGAWNRFERHAHKCGFAPNYLGYLIHHGMI
jgi:hypothetical protein